MGGGEEEADVRVCATLRRCFKWNLFFIASSSVLPFTGPIITLSFVLVKSQHDFEQFPSTSTQIQTRKKIANVHQKSTAFVTQSSGKKETLPL